MTNKTSYASSLPTRSLEEFPSLGKPSDPQKLEEFLFKRFLKIKSCDPKKNVSDVSPFVIERDLKQQLGKKYSSCKINRTRSGLLLVEVVQQQAFERLKQIKKIGDLVVKVEEHL